MNLFQLKRMLAYLATPNHWKGFGIHSPFVFDLVTTILRSNHTYYGLLRVDQARAALSRSSQMVDVTDMGAGSMFFNRSCRSISDITRHGSIPPKYGELLFKLTCRFEPVNILELGTSLGISTLYLALPNSNSKVVTIEGCPNLSSRAAANFEQLDIKNVQQLTGSFQDMLPVALGLLNKIDLLFVDGDHKEDSTLDYFYKCLPFAGNDSIFIFDDIHWSPGMESAWDKIRKNQAVTVSLDLFRLGILFFRKECQKEHFVIRY